ncbi:MAG: hypothetical protein GY810_03090 [Aureispira sp.]|nr:hypothetical protein [Aureispira sp.]
MIRIIAWVLFLAIFYLMLDSYTNQEFEELLKGNLHNEILGSIIVLVSILMPCLILFFASWQHIQFTNKKQNALTSSEYNLEALKTVRMAWPILVFLVFIVYVLYKLFTIEYIIELSLNNKQSIKKNFIVSWLGWHIFLIEITIFVAWLFDGIIIKNKPTK